MKIVETSRRFPSDPTGLFSITQPINYQYLKAFH